MRFIRDCERGSSFFTRPSDDEPGAVFGPPPTSDPRSARISCWLSEVRRAKRDKGTTSNDILVAALWYFLEKAEGKTKDQIWVMVPKVPAEERVQNKVTEMPKRKNKR